MPNKKPFNILSKFEFLLWSGSVFIIFLSFFVPKEKNFLNLIASLIGATALIFVSKGYVSGQVLTVIFSIFYGVISFYQRYYGEMITYLCMTTPMATLSLISWLKNPYGNTKEVKVNTVSRKNLITLFFSAPIVTLIFYFILRAMNNASLILSTFSITTSYVASFLTYLRSPYYALAYSFNDIVLIALWVIASVKEPSYIPMILCFTVFLLNDIYGFFNWQRMKKYQNKTNSILK